MKKILLSVLTLVTLLSSAAWAQFPGEYNRRGPPPVEYYERDPYTGHRRPPPPPVEKYRRDRDYDQRRGYPPGREIDRRQSQPRICVTSRGNCPADPRMLVGDNCSCSFPGFGMKRGNIR